MLSGMRRKHNKIWVYLRQVRAREKDQAHVERSIRHLPEESRRPFLIKEKPSDIRSSITQCPVCSPSGNKASKSCRSAAYGTEPSSSPHHMHPLPYHMYLDGIAAYQMTRVCWNKSYILGRSSERCVLPTKRERERKRAAYVKPHGQQRHWGGVCTAHA